MCSVFTPTLRTFHSFARCLTTGESKCGSLQAPLQTNLPDVASTSCYVHSVDRGQAKAVAGLNHTKLARVGGGMFKQRNIGKAIPFRYTQYMYNVSVTYTGTVYSRYAECAADSAHCSTYNTSGRFHPQHICITMA